MSSVRSRARPVCRLSPNEEAYLCRAQLEERRKQRLLQVREQEKKLAKQVRDKVKNKREAERRVLQAHVDATLAEAHEAELRELEEKYLSRVSSVGQGHRDAQVVNEEENRLQELRLLLEAKQRWRAQDRHAAAMKELSANQLKDKHVRQQAFHCRQQAMETERERARQIALAGPSSNPMIIMDFEVDRSQHVHFKEAEGYSSSYYHIPNPVVQRLGTPNASQPTAQEMAQQQEEEDKKAEQHAAALRQEHSEKARLRYKHAIAKVKLEKERVDMLAELQNLEREHRTSRQKALAKMPSNLFQPVHRRIEMATEQQREMEGAFERLFVRSIQDTAHCPSEEPLTSDQSKTPTELSSVDESPDTGPHLPVTAKATPDSGVRIDATISTEGSHQPPSTQDSGVVNESSALYNTTGRTHSFSQNGMLTISSSSSDQPHPAHPPRQAWPTRSADMSHDTPSSTDGEQLVPSRAASTQTPQKKKLLFRPSIVMDRPELTVTDVTSSDEQSVDDGDTDGRGLRGKPPPTQRKRSDGMKALLSMIHTQHQAWNDRLKKRDPLINVSPSPPLSPQATEVPVGPDTLSVYTLSSRESTVSPSPPSESELAHFSDQSGRSDQLSISQYHTTLETSALQTPPTTHTPSTSFINEPDAVPMSNTMPHPLVQHSQKYVPSSQSALHANTEQITVTSSDEEHLRNGIRPFSTPSHITTQSSSQPAVSSPLIIQTAPTASHLTQLPSGPQPTAFVRPPLLTTVEDDSQDTIDSFLPLPESPWQPPFPQLATVQLAQSPSESEADQYKQEPTNDVTSTELHSTLSSVPPPVNSAAASVWSVPPPVNSAAASVWSVPPPVNSAAASVWSVPPPVNSTAATSVPPPVSSAAAASVWSVPPPVNSTAAASVRSVPLPVNSAAAASVRSVPLPVNSAAAASVRSVPPPVNSAAAASVRSVPLPVNSAASLPMSSVTTTSVEPLPIPVPPPVSSTVSTSRENYLASPLLQDEEQPSVSDIAQEQLSILTLNSTQLSLAESSSPGSLPPTTLHSHPNDLLHVHLRQTGASPNLAQSTHDSSLKELSILDTIEETDTEPGVNSSDSFRGDRIQMDPPLSITGLETTGYDSQLPASPDKPATLHHHLEAESPKQVEESSTIEPPVERTPEGSPRSSVSVETNSGPSLVPSGLSLQEAFLNRKKDFVKKSQRRLEQIKANIIEQKAQQSSLFKQVSHSAPTSSKITHSKQSTSGASQSKRLDSGDKTAVEKKQRVVTFSSPLLQLQGGQGGHPSTWLFSREREKIKKKEMKERNERFYHKLPEVRKRKEEEQRRATYSANREKARDYQEKIRTKMMRKRTEERVQPKRVTTDTKIKTKPPFK